MNSTATAPRPSASTAPLSGKVALVTGASRGMGAGIARRLAADGAKVVIGYVASPEPAQAVVRAIKAAGGTALAIAADAGRPDEVKGAVAQAVATFGRLDILVNNAAIAIGKPVQDIALEDFERRWTSTSRACSSPRRRLCATSSSSPTAMSSRSTIHASAA